ncbi:hypothetical protein HYPSUDRAFT_60128 [Hypholoma sublateritium FD-334 SS-4]|uniref:Cytochrome P450 n=1 Tax=Hypholoma sublateritium (strain FD-334 SS-4) TaxID=945553 RepID=A0A0D2NWS4_HYPSF|nr:hypothetical protein HYPSUDRAFT_60128 [Hypholoma sublateritium FD-334 SS-4]
MSTLLPDCTAVVLVLSISAVVSLWALIWNTQPLLSKLPYPPGPAPTSAMSGNRIQIMSTPCVWRKYKEWAEEYGDIMYLRSFRQPVIVLNSFEDAVELLEKRSRIYSSRSVSPMYKLMGFNANTAIKEYGPDWRKHRRIFQQSFKPDSSLEYRPIQTRKMYDMLYGFLNTPEDFEAHIKTLAGAIILFVIYGYDVAPKDDHYVKLVESTRPGFGLGLSPKWLVNSFPALRHIPSWFPGAGFKQYASAMSERNIEAREATYKYAMTTLASSGNGYKPIACSLSDSYTSPTDLRILKEAAASGYGAGVGTTQGTITIFIEAMILFPDAQKKAQEEIDRVTRGKRLPEYDDEGSLPYIQALVREVVRWKPLLPLCLAHANDEDDMYKGYYIPKGILNDDDMTYVFGFGRRICPGRHLGLATVWLAVATILASFNLRRRRDASGNELPLNVKYTEYGVTCYPLPFECSITPRTDEARQLILEKRYEA